MNLHRSGKKPDWENVDANKRNFFQKIAAETNGIVTPGNVIGFGGLVLSLNGLRDVSKGKYAKGGVKVFVGRIADLADGFGADRTGTKSPFGEAVDVTFDNILLAAALLTLRHMDAITSEQAAKLVKPVLAGIASKTVAEKRGIDLHPSLEGKMATLGRWGAICSAVGALGARAAEHEGLGQRFDELTDACAEVSYSLGKVAAINYTKQAVGNPAA